MNRDFTTHFLVAFSATSMVCSAGCAPDGPAMAKVTGTVTIDSKPLAKAAFFSRQLICLLFSATLLGVESPSPE